MRALALHLRVRSGSICFLWPIVSLSGDALLRVGDRRREERASVSRLGCCWLCPLGNITNVGGRQTFAKQQGRFWAGLGLTEMPRVLAMTFPTSDGEA